MVWLTGDLFVCDGSDQAPVSVSLFIFFALSIPHSTINISVTVIVSALLPASSEYEYQLSQLRENSCWMFASTHDPFNRPINGCSQSDEVVTADLIRHWLGDFSSLKIVAKCAARIGQMFSTSLAVSVAKRTEGGRARVGQLRGAEPELGAEEVRGAVPVDFELATTDDITRNGACFTDGCGQISAAVMDDVCASCMGTMWRPESQARPTAIQVGG